MTPIQWEYLFGFLEAICAGVMLIFAWHMLFRGRCWCGVRHWKHWHNP